VTVAALVEPAFCTFPEYPKTLGPEISDLATLAGFAPDPEQRHALDLIFAMRPDNRVAAFEVAVVCSRQNLKTGLFKMAALGWLFLMEQRLVVWSAHEFRTAQEAFRDITELIQGCEYLDREVRNIYRGNGDEAIELRGGQRLIFKARTKGGGRGLSGDKVVLYEAFALQPYHMGALLPTLSARPDPQVVYGSSAGLVESSVLRGIRDRGRLGGDPSLAYLEWCDDLPGDCLEPNCQHGLMARGCRLDDVARWARSNPAMGRRITVEYIAAERRALPPAEFARERLGWWDDPDDQAEQFLAAWLACTDATSVAAGRPVFAVDVSPGSRSAAVVAATRRPDGRPHLELVEHRPGVDWLPGRCEQLKAEEPLAWILDPAGPAGALLPDLAEVGVEPHQMTARELGQACEGLTSAASVGAVAHLGDPILTGAISGAGRRDIGDGLWAWSRRKSGTDICPLVAATEAAWLLSTQPAEYDLLQSFY